jgi:NAD(P)-dependent dehydrogenase (short-subunit alcohol dehydrogenase family)
VSGSPDLDLGGKIALVTGAASGIGAATAGLLARLGASVVGADLADSAGEQVFAELGPPHRYVHLDVSDADAWRGLAGELGGLDVAFLNAGVMTRPPTVPLLDDPLNWLDPATYRKVMGVNADGVAYGLMAVLPLLEARGGGDVIVTSSTAGIQPFGPDPVYSASKYALIGLARSLAPTLAARGIRINVVCPHGTLTGIVPVDLRERPDKVFAPASYIAESVVRILDSGETGRVWLARSADEPAWPLELPDLMAREAYNETPAPS